MDTTAKTLVGGDDNEELALPGLFCGCVLEDLCERLSVYSIVCEVNIRTGVRKTVLLASLHGTLSLAEFCGGDHFHGLAGVELVCAALIRRGQA